MYSGPVPYMQIFVCVSVVTVASSLSVTWCLPVTILYVATSVEVDLKRDLKRVQKLFHIQSFKDEVQKNMGKILK